MSEILFKSQYWQDEAARAAFKQFILEIHGLDFSAWEAAGYWDDRYTPFSYFHDGKVIASVCVYLLKAVVDGQAAQLLQISGVGTDPAWRRRGLNRELTERALDWARGRYSGLFLFADEDAMPFYERCGFSRLQEYIHEIDLPEKFQSAPASAGGLTKLDPGLPVDRALIYAMAQARAPLSQRLSVLNAKLFMFHCLYVLSDCIYHIQALDCLILYRQQGSVLEIYDIVARRIPQLHELLAFVDTRGIELVRCHFHTDGIWIGSSECRVLEGNNAFTLGDFGLERPVFPFTARA